MLCNSELREYANHCDVVKIKNKLLFLTFIPVSLDYCNMHTNTHLWSGCTIPLPGRSRTNKTQKKISKQQLFAVLFAGRLFCCTHYVCFSSISCRYLARVVRIVYERNENKHFKENHWNRGKPFHKLSSKTVYSSAVSDTRASILLINYKMMRNENKTKNNFTIKFQPMISSDRKWIVHEIVSTTLISF